MPIPQSRMLALLSVFDEIERANTTLVEAVKSLVSDSLDEFYTTNKHTDLESNLLGRLQTIESLISAPHLSIESAILINTERQHFKHNGKRNERMARYMQNRRHTTSVSQ